MEFVVYKVVLSQAIHKYLCCQLSLYGSFISVRSSPLVSNLTRLKNEKVNFKLHLGYVLRRAGK
jgi:hypothetical protein